MRQEILASQPTDPADVARICAGQAPEGQRHWYQKHMCHHMIKGFPLDWANGAAHFFLIRHPARVIASYPDRRGHPTLADLGYERQFQLFRRFGGTVVDSATIRAAPVDALRALTGGLGCPSSRRC